MITEELKSFVKTQLNEGVSPESLREMLLEKGGWANKDIDELFSGINNPSGSPQAKNNLSTIIVLTIVVLLVVTGIIWFMSFLKNSNSTQGTQDESANVVTDSSWCIIGEKSKLGANFDEDFVIDGIEEHYLGDSLLQLCCGSAEIPVEKPKYKVRRCVDSITLNAAGLDASENFIQWMGREETNWKLIKGLEQYVNDNEKCSTLYNEDGTKKFPESPECHSL